MTIPGHPANKKFLPPEHKGKRTYQPKCDTCFNKSNCGPSCAYPQCTWCLCTGKPCRPQEGGTGCGVVCRGNHDVEMHLANVNSFDLTPFQVAQNPASNWKLPRYIPKVVMSAGFPLGIEVPKWTYCMSYHTLTNRQDVICDREWAMSLKDMFPDGSQLLLDFFSPDTIVDPIWYQYSRYGLSRHFWDQEVFQNFDGIIAVNHSIYIDDPMMQRWISLKRTFISAQEIYDAGLNVIPLLSWSHEIELRRAVEAIASQMENVNTIAIQLHMIDIDRVAALQHNIELLAKYIAPMPWRVIINGLTSSWAIAELRKVFGNDSRFTFMNANAWMNTVKMNVANEFKTEYFNSTIQRYTDWGNGLELPVEKVKVVADEELTNAVSNPEHPDYGTT